MVHTIEVTLAGLTFSCALRYSDAAVFPAPDPAAPKAFCDTVRLTREDWDYYLEYGMPENGHTEYSLLTAPFSDALMDFDRLIMHGVALRWRDRAYLICGVPGVGKSTQARFLQELRPGEFGVICGDRPILQFVSVGADAYIGPQTSPACRAQQSGGLLGDSLPLSQLACDNWHPQAGGPATRPVEGSSPDNEILVHPSPWNGKENWHGAEAAPLAGLILLERGEENRLVSLTEREAAIPLYTQVIQTTVQEKRICQSAALITRLLQAVPIWRLTTYQVPDSTKLLLESIFSV